MEFGNILIYMTSFFGLFTTTYFLFTLFQSKSEWWKGDPKECRPVTVCVPCFNEEKTVLRTLRSLLDLDYDRDKLEIIVVDDGSNDNTYSIAKEYADSRPDYDIKVFRKENGGKYTALNLALEKCRGEFFGALDADSYVDRKALKRIMKYFEDNKVTAVTPAMMIGEPKSFIQKIQAVEFHLGVLLRKVFALMGSIHVTPGPFSIFRKSFFDKYGGYKKGHLTEDIELSLRIQDKGGIIENALDGYVYTLGENNWTALKKQRTRWYFGFLRNMIDYKHLFSPKQGSLGLFILPISIISVVLLIISILYAFYSVTEQAITKISNLAAINFDLSEMSLFNFDIFFLNMEPYIILGFIGLFVTIGFIVFAKKLSKDPEKKFRSYIYFLIAYWVLYGYWWALSIYQAFFKKDRKWGHKSGDC
ncbi:MAG: glycosyltransferase [Nanoarchaeota archaeon]